ncbi:23S rRNA (guanosine(2251)-2'-O)-methyltransferase RlmB [Edaphobacter sp. 12200R-103]|jgi:23S rRNA (guanosine2251-2'-O)-methyltransferase|uniref:23S rRNA (guanosine(2251)-2'-O)-methyltransferase RlmB n=1 Tax=Edaphobacter sp. 12200R-103 TaxID=2703788 RepID=UPI00138BBFB8|nr:23S rRNA (guanosine(2251)-2'-O)-methyltransferase RlmB [Edaphobacter sp. 12200R-103]QHS52298.1 23S rRNA (guanosine(2251)-2'-O)-methyltransferase RlmB [Edaphobacter sp. 12200R-103]
MEVLFGLHPIEEAIRAGSGRLDRISIARERRDARLEKIAALARSAGIRVALEPREQLTRAAKTDAHQGVIAFLRDRAFLSIEDLLVPPSDGHHRFFLALDGIEDPHNLGALLRTADGAGVDGILVPERRSAPITPTVAKTSAGASEHVRIARVTNLVRSLEQMKKANVWVIGLDERGTPDYMDFDFTSDCVLVLGREGAGLHDLVKKTCDHLLRIPMAGKVSSLNVSVAGAVVMYEAMRQRRATSVQPMTAPAPATTKKRKGLGSL